MGAADLVKGVIKLGTMVIGFAGAKKVGEKGVKNLIDYKNSLPKTKTNYKK